MKFIYFVKEERRDNNGPRSGLYLRIKLLEIASEIHALKVKHFIDEYFLKLL